MPSSALRLAARRSRRGEHRAPTAPNESDQNAPFLQIIRHVAPRTASSSARLPCQPEAHSASGERERQPRLHGRACQCGVAPILEAQHSSRDHPYLAGQPKKTQIAFPAAGQARASACITVHPVAIRIYQPPREARKKAPTRPTVSGRAANGEPCSRHAAGIRPVAVASLVCAESELRSWPPDGARPPLSFDRRSSAAHNSIDPAGESPALGVVRLPR
jgi:hypothetical protein